MASLDTASVNSQANNVATDFTTGSLIIYSGPPPSTANGAITSVHVALVTHALAGWGTSAVGKITANEIATVAISASGTASFARIANPAKTQTIQLTLGIGGSSDLIVSSLSYINGEDSMINSLTITQPSS